MKHIILSAALLACGPAFATCPSPITGNDAAGTSRTFNIYADNSSNCNTVVAPSLVLNTLTVLNTSTALNATQVLAAAPHGAPAVLLQLDQGANITAGAVTFEGTYDGTNWVTIPVAQLLNPNTLVALTNPYTMVASTNQPFLILTQGYQSVRMKQSTQITTSGGAGTTTPFVALLSYNPVLGALLNPLAAGTAIIGKVGVDQTTPGTTNAVQSIAGATGGATISSAIAPATPAGVNLKASAGTVYSIQASTIQSTPVYVKLYNASSAPTCGSGTPVARFMVPAAATAANGAGTNIQFPVGVAFGTGIGYCVTGALADADTTAITAADTLVNIEWN